MAKKIAPKPIKTEVVKEPSGDAHLKVAPGDLHFVANLKTNTLKCFAVESDGRSENRYNVPVRGYGANGPGWSVPGGDTPPGPYRAGSLHEIPESDPQSAAFGPFFLDLEELNGQEMRYGRAGIGMHGGGSGLADPWHAARQGWQVTHGCLRLQNEDLMRVMDSIKFIRKRGGEAFITVVW